MTPARRHNDEAGSDRVYVPTDAEFAEQFSTQERIEKAAAKLFAAKGIDGTTTREIASLAGCSEGAIYRYWPSKEILGRALFLGMHYRIAVGVRCLNAKGMKIEDHAAAIVGIYCELAERKPDLFAFHLMSTNRFLPTPEGTDNPVEEVENIVQGAMQRGEIPNGDPVVVAAMALGVVTQTALHKVYGRIEGPLVRHAPAIARAVIAVLKSEGAAS